MLYNLIYYKFICYVTLSHIGELTIFNSQALQSEKKDSFSHTNTVPIF